MKRLIVLFSLVTCGFGLISAAAPATASAANCTNIWTDPITRYVSGGYQVMKFAAHIGGCTSDVELVKFRYLNSGYNDYGPVGCGNACKIFHQAYLGGGTSDIQNPACHLPNCNIEADGYAQTCWYGAGIMRVLRSTFQWAIKPYAGVFGPFHPYERQVDEGITC